MPAELQGLLAKPRRVMDVERADVDLVKKVIESTLRAEEK